MGTQPCQPHAARPPRLGQHPGTGRSETGTDAVHRFPPGCRRHRATLTTGARVLRFSANLERHGCFVSARSWQATTVASPLGLPRRHTQRADFATPSPPPPPRHATTTGQPRRAPQPPVTLVRLTGSTPHASPSARPSGSDPASSAPGRYTGRSGNHRHPRTGRDAGCPR